MMEERRRPRAFNNVVSSITEAAKRKSERLAAGHAHNHSSRANNNTINHLLKQKNKEFILCLFNNCMVHVSMQDGHELWERLAFEWKNDRDVAMAALIHNCVKVSDLPEILQSDRNFFMEAVRRNPLLCWILPEPFDTDIEFPRSIRSFPSDWFVNKYFERFPVLRHERETWTTIVDSHASLGSLNVILERHAPVDVRSDVDIMFVACLHDISILRLVDCTLHQMRDFVEAVLGENSRGIEFLSHEAQLLFPEFVARSFDSHFSKMDEYSSSHTTATTLTAKLECYIQLLNKLSPDLWLNRNVVKAWFLAGGPFLGDRFPVDWRSDKEIFMWIAQSRDLGYCRYSFQKYAAALILGNKEFMLQIVETNHSLFQYASPHLHLDFDVALLFFARAGSLRASSHFWSNYYGAPPDDLFAKTPQRTRLTFILGLMQKIDEKLKLHHSFLSTVLFGLSAQSEPNCILSLLNLGAETTAQGCTKLIAEYLDVPTGQDLLLFRKALANLPVCRYDFAEVGTSNNEDYILSRRFYSMVKSMQAELNSDDDESNRSLAMIGLARDQFGCARMLFKVDNSWENESPIAREIRNTLS